jgi:hypothetical protein
LNENKLKPGGMDGKVSFSRDKNFKLLDEAVTFVLNGEKLSNDYKIKPFDYFNFGNKSKADPRRATQQEVEFEETIDKTVEPLDRYLTEIHLNGSIDNARNHPRGAREELREAYEDLIAAIIKYKEDNYTSNPKVFFKGKEVDEVFLYDEIESVKEGIYNKNSGTRVYYTKAADEDSYRVYYSSYKPIIGKTPDEFMNFLKQKGIEHTKAGGSAVKMNKANVEKLKKSMLNLQEKLVMDVEPEVEKELTHLFHIDDPLTKAINIIVKPAHDMAQKGESRPDSMLDKRGQIKAAVALRDAYFPGQMQFVNDKHFDALAKHNKVYYRGVHEKKFVDDLHYNITNFMGHSNEYQGSWMTDDKKYAQDYHYDEHPLEIIIKPDAKIGMDKEIDSKRSEYMRKMMQLQDYADKEIEGDRFKEVHHQAHYLKDYLMNSAVLAIALHYDGVRFTLDHGSEVIIMFNREKMVVRNPEQ